QNRSAYPGTRRNFRSGASVVLPRKAPNRGGHDVANLCKRSVEKAESGKADYFLWDDDLRGFGLRVFATGKRSYIVQYRAKGRTRRFTIGPHGVWTPETARKQARILLGRIAHGDNPAEERYLDNKAITV